jgi:hypothetical protein
MLRGGGKKHSNPKKIRPCRERDRKETAITRQKE